MSPEKEAVSAKKDTNQEAEVLKKEAKETKGKQITFDPQTQAKLVEIVMQDAEQFEGDRTEWVKIRQECWKLYEGIRDEKTEPWKNCSNISTMIATTVTDLIHSRLVPMVSNSSLLWWQPRDKNDIDNAENVRVFMKWVVDAEIDFPMFVDDAVRQMVIDGTVCAKVVWDVSYKWVQRKIPRKFLGFKWKYDIKYEYARFEKARLVIIDPEDVLLPYNATDVDTASSCIHRWWRTLPELKHFQRRGKMVGIDDTMETGLEQYLEKEEGGKVEKARAEGRTWMEARKNTYPILCYEWYGKVEYKGEWREVQLIVAPQVSRLVSAQLLTDISRIEERPLVVEPFIRRPGRILGKSVCEQVRHLQKEMDAIHNQRIDAGTIAISPFFFYRPASGFNPEEVEIGPGFGIPLDDPRNDVMFPQFPSQMLQVSFQEERIILELVEKLTSVSAYQLGNESDIVKSRATASGTMAIIGQGEQKFSILGKRAQIIIGKVLNKALRKYQENMDPYIGQRVLGIDKPLFPEGLAPEDIAGQYDSFLELDLSASNKSLERQTWQVMFPQAAQDPFVTQDPARAWELRNRFYKIMGITNPEDLIGPKPPSAHVDADAEEEFQRMLQGEEISPKENENAYAHLLAHVAQLNSPRFSRMPKEYRAFLIKHIQDTRQLQTQQMQQQLQAAAQANQPTDTGGAAPLNQTGLNGNQPTAGQTPQAQGAVGASQALQNGGQVGQ